MKFYSFWRSQASFRVRIALNLKKLPTDVVFVDLDADAHTVEAVLSAGTAVERYYFVEELEISDTAIEPPIVAIAESPIRWASVEKDRMKAKAGRTK